MKNRLLPIFKRTISVAAISFTFVLCATYFTMGAGRDGGSQGLSRSMEQAIRMYNQGLDNEAMDRFMNILVRGTPSEKALANDYLNRITNRMHAGEITLKDSSEGISPVPRAPITIPIRKKPALSRDLMRRIGLPEEDTVDRDALIKKNIDAKISVMRKDLLSRLYRQKGVKIFMDAGLPQAIEFNVKSLFSKQTNFSSAAPDLLSDLSGLMFTAGKARFIILPNGAMKSDVKMLDMRRAIAVNSYLMRRGISSARVEVNLMGINVRLPPKLRIIRELAILFIYDEDPRLQTLIGADKGPQISLGVYPTSISPHNDEGAIIEFSIMEPREGLPTWNFQIQKTEDGDAAGVIQEATGSEAAYHQIYWNGKKNFFGDSFPPGKYICILSASDIHGRKNVSQRLIVLQPGPGAYRAAKPKPRPMPAAKPPAESMSSKMSGKAIVLSSYRKSAKRAEKASLTALRVSDGTGPIGGPAQNLPKGESEADAAGGGEITEFSGQVSYKIIFRDRTTTLTSDGEKKIRQVADTMNYWPLAKLTLVGYAYSKEPKADSVALERANIVASVLTNSYGVNNSRMQVLSRVTNVRQSMVEIKMVSRK